MLAGRRRLLVTVIGLVAAVVLAVLLRPRGSTTTQRTTTRTTGSDMVQVGSGASGTDPTTGAPAWIARPGARGRKVAGIVVGEDGQPIAGATVRLASRFSSAGLVAAPVRKTDAQGAFDFGAQPATEWVVSAEQSKLTATLVSIDLSDAAARPAPDQLRIVLHPCVASIHGTIFDTVGGTIPHATVTRLQGGVMTNVSVEGDDAGAYELCVPAGGEGVAVGADGYATLLERVDVYGRTQRDFRLVPGTPVAGKVVRTGDHEPVADAIVELRAGEGGFRGETPIVTVSGPDGAFHFDAVAPGDHRITAKGDHVASEKPTPVTVELGTAVDDVVVEVAASHRVSGRVVAKGTQSPVEGKTVALMVSDRAMRRRPDFDTSHADGTFVFDHVLDGSYLVTLDMPWRRGDQPTSPATEVKGADVTDVVLESEPVGTIAGRVLLDGKPVDGAEVRVGEQSGMAMGGETTASDGTFELRGLAAGTYSVYAQSQLVGAFTKGPKVTLAAGEKKTGVDVVLDLAGSIAGVVIDQNESPVAGAYLSFSLLGGNDFGSATTADDGSFTVRALSGGGDYVFEVKQRESSAYVYPPATGKRHVPISVADGATHVTGVRIKVRYERLTISGRFVDRSGKPVPDATVRAEPDDDRGWMRSGTSTLTDQTGAFVLRDLTVGAYTLMAKSARGTATAVNIAAGATNVTLTVQGSGSIEGTLEGFRGTPTVYAVPLGADTFVRIETKVTGTTFQFRDLAPGRYRLVASAPEGRDAIGVDVVADQTTTAKLVLTATGTVQGRVLDEKTRAPVAGMRCVAVLQRAEDSEPDGSNPPSAPSDATGAFTVRNAPVGLVNVACFGSQRNGWTQVTVTASQPASVEVLVSGGEEGNGRRDIGMDLENQLSDVLVARVTPGGIAAKAGILVGDAIVSVDGKPIGRWGAQMAESLIAYSAKAQIVVVIERKDQQSTLTLALPPLPAAPSPP